MSELHHRITDRIVAAIEAGTPPWKKTWSGPLLSRPLRGTGEPYKGVNTLLLWLTSLEKGYASPYWMTFRQALDLGAAVRKGEKSTEVVFYQPVTDRDERDDGEDDDRPAAHRGILRRYHVFNAQQIDGLPAGFHPPAPSIQTERPIPEVETWFAALGAQVVPGEPSYSVALDLIRMPDFSRFESARSYYATWAHEQVHWTRHPSRLDRDFGRKKWGDEGYAMEELVAEIGAAFICADLGLPIAEREDHAAYMAFWLAVLRNDSRAIFSAASHAQKAVDYLHSLQPAAARIAA